MCATEKAVWFLIGASLGAGFALLYAPQSGKDTRKQIRRKAEAATDSLAEAGGHIKHALAEKGERIADAGKEVYRKSASAVAGAAESAGGLLSRARG
jgi:gas vesicle protein